MCKLTLFYALRYLVCTDRVKKKTLQVQSLIDWVCQVPNRLTSATCIAPVVLLRLLRLLRRRRRRPAAPLSLSLCQR